MNFTKKLLIAAVLLAPLSAFAATEITAGTDFSNTFTPSATHTGTWDETFYTTASNAGAVAVAVSSEFTFAGKGHGVAITSIELKEGSTVVATGTVSPSTAGGVTAYTATVSEYGLAANTNYDLIIGYTSSANPYSISNDINVVAAVPEASEYAMMLAGLPLLALATRKKSLIVKMA